jgi:hypothetical protein
MSEEAEAAKPKKKKVGLSPQEMLNKVRDHVKRLQPYSLFIFLIFVAALYGFVLLRVHNLNAAEPSPDAVSSQVKAAQIPRIDPAVVQQLQSLQNNSVSVQALFNQARSNPFQE